jgi:hypothetical protein
MTEEQTQEQNRPDSDTGKGAVESDKPGLRSDESEAGQLGHRDPNSSIKANDTDFPEPDAEGEHSGESR